MDQGVLLVKIEFPCRATSQREHRFEPARSGKDGMQGGYGEQLGDAIKRDVRAMLDEHYQPGHKCRDGGK